MAPSTRSSRRSSRKPSPAVRNTKQPSTVPTESTQPEKKKTVVEDDEWEEPPVRRPVPSYEDYNGSAFMSVLQNMQPLGTFPTTADKAKAKPEPFRRLKKGVGAKKTDVGGVPARPQSAGSGDAPSANSGTTTERNSVAPSSSSHTQSQVQAQEEPATATTATTTTTSTTPATSSPVDTPAPTLAHAQVTEVTSSTQTAPDRAKMKTVIDAAVSRATESNHTQTGLAIQRMYEESLDRPELLVILDAVLGRRATIEQTNAFKAYIESARQPRKTEGSGDQTAPRSPAASSTRASPKPPVRKSLRNAQKPKPVMPEPTDTRKKSTRATRGKKKATNATASENPLPDAVENKPIRSTEPSRSGSTSSSLSSAKSLIDDQELVSSTGGSNGPNANQPQPEHAPSTMATSSAPQLHNFSTSNPTTSVTKGQKRKAAAAALAEQDRLAIIKRRKAARAFDHIEIPESGIRSGLLLKEPQPVQSTSSKETPASTTSTSTQMAGNPNGNVKKRPAPDDGDNQAPLSANHAGDAHASTSAATRRPSRTENGVNAQERPAKRAKTARTKMSPVKNKKGVIAGVAPSSTTPVGNEGMSDYKQDNNNDYCSACGGGGMVICCDGCPRSFHGACLEPPADQNSLPEPWFCQDCTAKRAAQMQQPAGLFGGLVQNLNTRNPVAYNMPPEIRNYFEEVETGKDGEYVDVLRRAKATTRSTFYEHQDGKEQPLSNHHDKKDKDNHKFMFCFKCRKSTINGQKMVQCDYCPLYWHLDCIDPPIPHFAPRQGANGQDLGDWMCPAHVDHDLMGTDPSYRLYARNIVGNNPYSTNRTRKVRRPKHAKVIDMGMKGDTRNRGFIEVETDPSDDDFYERECGATLRIPAKRIKLDFIGKIHATVGQTIGQQPKTKSREDMLAEEAENQEIYAVARAQAEKTLAKQARLEGQSVTASGEAAATVPNGDRQSEEETSIDEAVATNATTEDDSTVTQIDPKDDFYKRSLIDQQAALNLAQFAQSNNDINMGGDEIQNLINTLIAEAPPEAITMMATNEQQEVPSGNEAPVQDMSANALSERERASLLMLQELIRRRLEMHPVGGATA